jgi:hypothetical protein
MEYRLWSVRYLPLFNDKKNIVKRQITLTFTNFYSLKQ